MIKNLSGHSGKLFAVLITSLLLSCNKHPAKQQELVSIVSEVNDFPNVILIDETGKRFSAKTLSGNTLLIFFGATCDHCQREAADIEKNLKGFNGYSLYFVAMDPFPIINQFAKDYKLERKENVHFLRADGATVNEALGYIQTPTILLYADNRALIKRFDGETKVEEILKAL